MKMNQILAASLCVLTPLAHATDTPILDEVVITATRIEQPLTQTLSSTSVITQEDIKNSQAADLPSLLRTIAGVEISQSGGTGKVSSLYLRGNESKQVLVLLDGVRINSATSGTTAIENLMPDQIERIEVVRGNVSSLYGSEAIGGVVQIFTKRGRGEPAFNISAGAGTHHTQRMSAGFAGKSDKTDFSLQLSRFITEGVSAYNPALNSKANPDNDGYSNTSLSGNVRQAFNDDHSLSASIFDSRGHNSYDGTGTTDTATDIHNSDVQISKYSLASDNRLSDAWQSKIQLAQGVDSTQHFKNGLPATPGSLYKTSNQQAIWQNTLQLDTHRKLLAGFEYLGQQISSDLQPAYAQDSRKVNSLFAGYTGNYGSHQLQTNLRQDNNSQYGVANTGLVGYGYAFSETWRATTSYSTGFRAPTFNELYYVSAFYNGNPALRPEQSRNFEAGVHYANNDQLLDFNYFDNRTNDLIDFTPKNINEARIDGLELSYAGKFDDNSLKAAITIQNARDLTNNKALLRRANTHSSVAATHKMGDLHIGAEWIYSDTRQDSGSKTLEAYHVFNITAGYSLNKQWKASFRADNLTDQNDSNAYGYNPLGRTFYASMNYQQ